MRTLMATLGLLTLATFATAQGRGVGTSTWTDGDGNNVNVTVTDTPGPGNSVTFQDSGGFSSAVNGQTAPGSTAARPTVQSTPPATINSGTQTPNISRVRTITLCGQYRAQVEKSTDGGGSFFPLRSAKRWRRGPRMGIGSTDSPGNVGSLPGGGGPAGL